MALSPVFTDAFTGTNETALSTYDAGWTTAAGTPIIQSNELEPNGGSGCKAYRNTGTYSNDQYAQGVVTNAWLSSQYPGLSVRASGDDATYTAYSFNVNSESGSDLTSGSWSPSVGDEVRIEVTGSSPAVISLYLNDTLVDDYSDASSPIASGRPGIAWYTQDSPSCRLNDFEAGDITGAAANAPKRSLLLGIG